MHHTASNFYVYPVNGRYDSRESIGSVCLTGTSSTDRRPSQHERDIQFSQPVHRTPMPPAKPKRASSDRRLMNNELQACHAKALDASCAGQWDLAREYIEKGLACDARNADLLHLRGRVDLALLRNAEAVHWLELTVEASSDPNIHNSLCVALTRVGAFRRAADVARAGLDLPGARASMPEASLLWFNLGLALQLQDNLDEARLQHCLTPFSGSIA